MRKKNSKSLEELIQEHRKKKKRKRWRGALVGYLEQKVKNNPELNDSAHARSWKTAERPGVRIKKDKKTLLRHGRPIKEYERFKDFYGVKVKEQIERFVDALKQAAMRGEASRQIIYLKGPVASGKSSLIATLMAGLENEVIYAIEGCLQRDNPLLLIPRALRKEVEQRYNLKTPIEGDICPNCRFRLLEEDKLAKYYTEEGEVKKKYKKRWPFGKKLFQKDGTPIWKKIVKDQEFKYRDENGNVLFEKFPVVATRLSKRARVGLVSMDPIDPNSQDITEFIGEENISLIDKLAPGDPRLARLIGAFNASNRGVLELIEIFENDREYLRPLLTASQEHLVKAPSKQQMNHYDGLIVGHSNPPQWERFKNDPENVNYLDRILIIDFPYPLELDEEIKIYKKEIAKAEYKDIHIAPFALEIPGMLALFSRYKKDEKYDLLIKLKAYTDGVVVTGSGRKITALQLREEFPDEGMFGLSSRFIRKEIVDNVAVRSKHNCIDPITIFEMAVKAVKEADLSKEIKKKYLGWLQGEIIQEYKKFLAQEIAKYSLSDVNEELDELFQEYRRNAEIYVERTKRAEENKDEPKEDSAILDLVEQALNLQGTAKENFRKDFVKFVRKWEQKGIKIKVTSYRPLTEALKKVLIFSSEFLKSIFGKKEKEIIKKMTKEGGYCKYCAKRVLEFTKQNLWRD